MLKKVKETQMSLDLSVNEISAVNKTRNMQMIKMLHCFNRCPVYYNSQGQKLLFNRLKGKLT